MIDLFMVMVGVAVLLFIGLMFGMWIERKTVCDHHSHHYKHLDFHRGGNGEMYIRGRIHCWDCDWNTTYAIRLPDHITDIVDNSGPGYNWIKKD